MWLWPPEGAGPQVEGAGLGGCLGLQSSGHRCYSRAAVSGALGPFKLPAPGQLLPLPPCPSMAGGGGGQKGQGFYSAAGSFAAEVL